MMKQRLMYAEREQHCTNPLAKKLFALMDTKKSNLALSADVTSAQALLEIAELVGPEICLLKTHIDIIDDFSMDLIQQLEALAKKHQFLIFEDRKFADIGNTVKHQYEGGVYRIADWADIINAHSLPGSGIVSGLAEVGMKKQRGLLLLAEMSSAGNLFTPEYTQKTLQMAEAFAEFVIGFISQRKLSADPRWIYMTPGIQLAQGKDALGQQYTTPKQAILENNSDIIIVGRGILQAKDPREEAKKYRDAGWDAYNESLLVSAAE
jgi:orotidine 5'-phosphate decarboxylase subfamily 1